MLRLLFCLFYLLPPRLVRHLISDKQTELMAVQSFIVHIYLKKTTAETITVIKAKLIAVDLRVKHDMMVFGLLLYL